MKLRNALIAGAAVFTFGALPAAAQEMRNAPASAAATQNSALTVIKNDDTMVQPYNITVGKLEGMDIVGSDGKKIGDVEDVLADSSGKPVAVSVDAGSFLQMNKKEVIMQIGTLQMRDNKLHTSMSKDQISALPDHND
ncbi:MAG TPA: PRC-barrel domain-containing protein [Alphaproteobacteria bacterium]|nr:PRC-barrel domain-containing protein [Alphaproteobacteria bacterium]